MTSYANNSRQYLGQKGTTATPTYSFMGDNGSGWYLSGAQTVSLTLGGSTKWTFGSSGQIGIGGATYGTAGYALVSGGPSSPPTWYGPVVNTTDAQTLTNKWIQPRVLSLSANSATPAVNTDSYDMVVITAQTSNITSMTSSLTGTPVNGQKLWISFTASSGTPSITWGTSFESSTVTLPTTMSTTRSDVGFVWNVATSKWRCVASA